MNELRKRSPDAQIILGATLLYVVNSFFDWQQYCASFGGTAPARGGASGTASVSSPRLFAIALLIWEINRMLKLAKVPIDQALVSVGAAVTLLVLTVLTFLVNNEFRHWPQWVGLILSIVIVVMAVRRGRSEGVQMPTADSIKAMGGGTRAEPRQEPPTGPEPALRLSRVHRPRDRPGDRRPRARPHREPPGPIRARPPRREKQARSRRKPERR